EEGSAAFHYPHLAVFDTAFPAPWFLSRSGDKSETGDPRFDAGTGQNAGFGGVCSGNIAECTFDAHMHGDRLLVLASAKSRAIEIYDIERRRNVFKRYNLPRGDLLVRALIVGDGKLVLQINSDGSFVGFRLADAQQLFEGRYVDDEVVVW